VTDYDCWYEEETGQTVSIDVVVQTMNKNIATAQEIIRRTVSALPSDRTCGCGQALAGAIMTEKSLWPKDTVNRLLPLLQKYI